MLKKSTETKCGAKINSVSGRTCTVNELQDISSLIGFIAEVTEM